MPNVPITRTLDQVACAVEIPGIRNLAPILMHRSGRFTLTGGLSRADATRCAEWIRQSGDRFRALHADLLDPECTP